MLKLSHTLKHIKSIGQRHRLLSVLYILFLVLQPAFLLMPKVDATANVMTYTLVRFDRMKTSTATTGTVCAKPTTAGTVAEVKVTFPAGYTVSATVGNWSVSTGTTTGWPKDPADGTTSPTAWPGISAPTGSGDFIISGQSVTFGSSTLTVGTWYCFNWTNTAALSTSASATNNNTGSVVTAAAGATAIDTGNYATATVGSPSDQIAVTASVNATFSFALSSSTTALGTLSSASPTAGTAINATVSTNAYKGWNMWASDPTGTPGLTSAATSKTIAYSPAAGSAVATLTAGNEGYNVGAGTASGTTCTGVTTDANFASGGTTYRGGGLDGTLRMLAVSTGVANACALPLTVNASISNTTPPATDYTDTVTIVAAGRF